jgi:hypothetical protein
LALFCGFGAWSAARAAAEASTPAAAMAATAIQERANFEGFFMLINAFA